MPITRRALLAGTAAGLTAAATPKRPNLVYVFADQLRYQSCGYAGDEYARTPNIDRLAAQGCNFHQAISNTPVCAPYRASLLTGTCQSSTGMVINELRLSPEHETLGRALSRGGYRTAYIGKWHLWANELGHHDETRNGFVPPGPYRLGFDNYWAAYNFNHSYYKSPYFENDATRHIRSQYEPDSQTDAAIQYMKSQAKSGSPFALFLSWGPPHDPWDDGNAPAAYRELYRGITLPRRPNYSETSDPYADNWAKLPDDYPRVIDAYQRNYYAQTANLDWNVGRLMEAIDRMRLAEDTIFVFTSDHGEMFGAHGRRAKYIFYDEAVRVPFLMRWPGRIPAKRTTDALLGTPDIMPTLLSMMNLPVPRSVEGADLSRHALGQDASAPDAAHLQGMGTTAAWTDGTEWRALRDHEYTYAVYRRDGRELLFHHRSDPYQMRDLAGERSAAATLRHYREKSQAWRKERNDTFETCTWYRDHWTRDRNITMTASGVKQDLSALDQIRAKWLKA
jgi:arylsulfatase A-like enzyme